MRLNYLAHKLRAMALIFAGRQAGAEAVFERMLELWPDDLYALSSRSFVRAQLGRKDEAIDDARRLVRQHPQANARHWFNLGFMLEAADQLDEAIDAFRKAVALDPKLDRAWYGLGLALIRQSRFEEAAEALKRNTELQPMSPYGWYQLARVHMDRHEPDEARKIIRHLQGFEPKVAAQLQRDTGLT